MRGLRGGGGGGPAPAGLADAAGTVARRGFSLGRLSDWIAGLRNRLVADPKLQRLAAGNPLTRGVARTKSRELFDLCAGFVYSQILAACVDLDLFERIGSDQRAIAELADELGLTEAALVRLVDAAAALDLLAWRSDGRVGLGELGAALSANPGVVAMVRHHGALYQDLADPVALLRGGVGKGRLSAYWSYAVIDDPSRLSDGEVGPYSDLMAASQQFICDEVLAAYPVRRHRRLLDIGGGDGTFARAAARASAHLEAVVFDLPAVAERARRKTADAGLGKRVQAVGGDFMRDELPAGADLVSLVRVLYDHGDETIAALLRSARGAIAPGGRLIVAEPMADAPGARRVGDAYFGFYLLAMGSGRSRSADELTGFIRQAGFCNVRAVATRLPLQTGLIVADA